MDGQVTVEDELVAAAKDWIEAARAASQRINDLEAENVRLRRELAKKRTSRWRRS